MTQLTGGSVRRLLPTFGFGLILALVVGSYAVHAAAPVSLDRDVSDVTPWLRPFEGTAANIDAAKPASDKRWLALDLSNPTKQEAHRIITLDAGSGGLLRFLDPSGAADLSDVIADGEGGKAEVIAIGGEKVVDLHLGPLSKTTIALYSEGPIGSATWLLWKPEVLAVSKQTHSRRRYRCGCRDGAFFSRLQHMPPTQFRIRPSGACRA